MPRDPNWGRFREFALPSGSEVEAKMESQIEKSGSQTGLQADLQISIEKLETMQNLGGPDH